MVDPLTARVLGRVFLGMAIKLPNVFVEHTFPDALAQALMVSQTVNPYSLTRQLKSRNCSQVFDDDGANGVNTAVICSTASGKV